jgi:hypothetical protein
VGGKGQLQTPKHKSKEIVQMGVKNLGFEIVNWIHIEWRPFVQTVMNLLAV